MGTHKLPAGTGLQTCCWRWSSCICRLPKAAWEPASPIWPGCCSAARCCMIASSSCAMARSFELSADSQFSRASWERCCRAGTSHPSLNAAKLWPSAPSANSAECHRVHIHGASITRCLLDGLEAQRSALAQPSWPHHEPQMLLPEVNQLSLLAVQRGAQPGHLNTAVAHSSKLQPHTLKGVECAKPEQGSNLHA